MRLLIVLIMASTVSAQAIAQIVITGRITTIKNEAIVSATVSIQGTGEGTNTDSSGLYKLSTAVKGKNSLVISFVGYTTKEISVIITGTSVQVDAVLKEETKQLDAVVVSAGTFEASDKEKG